MTKQERRQAIVDEAKSWIGTPYVSNGLVKGRRGGTDCAMVLIGVYANAGFISGVDTSRGYVPPELDPRPYPPQWHVHRNEERYLKWINKHVYEVPGPPEREPLPGDLVLFKIGHTFAHGAIITNWPNVVHALGNDMVVSADVSKATTGKRALWLVTKQFFSPFRDET